MNGEFLTYLAGLPQEGETLLLVHQKPRQPMEYHADGACVSTRSAHLPERARIRPGEAWYAVNGAFILDRFPTGARPSWKAEYVEFVLFMVLDDIGTKSKEPPLPPTWVIETSPGSYQWGYVFSDQPTKADYVAAYRAIADAGYTDPGAGGPARLCRIPGSVNLKQGRDMFAARLVTFEPSREYTLNEICAALGVTPAAGDTSQHRSVRVRDTGHDSVLAWLSEQGLVLTRPNADGWLGVVCPNASQHSDGNPEGRYLPATRAYCCYHGHCEGLNSAAFLAWVGEQGGPRVMPGLREELLAERMRLVGEKIAPSEMFSDSAAKAIAEVEIRERGRLERADWFKRYAYVLSDHMFFDLESRREVSRAGFDALYRHIPCKSVRTGRSCEASIWYDENRQALGAIALTGITYAAGEDVIVAHDGEAYGNRWRDARPKDCRPGDITPWLDHMRLLIPEESEREHVLDIMAHKVQFPRVKINHAVLHGGDEGCGKDTLWAPFLWAIGGPRQHNRATIDNEQLSSQWGYALESEVLILNELRESEAKERRAMANRLKPLVAAPPETLTVNRKGLHPYELPNRLFVLAFTNDPLPLSLPSQDRRWLCIWSKAPRMRPDAADRLWTWFEAGGYEAIAAALHARDVRAFNAKEAPPETEWKLNLIEQSMSAPESWLVEELRDRRGEFAAGAIAAPFHGLLDRLSGSAPAAMKLSVGALLHALKEAGWRDCGRIASADFPSKRHVYSCLDNASKSELRRIVEAAAPRRLSVVPGSAAAKEG